MDDEKTGAGVPPPQILCKDMISGPVLLPVGGHGKKSGGLIDDDKPLVLIENGKGEGRPLGGREQSHLLTGGQGEVKLPLGHTVHQYLPTGEYMLDAVAGQTRHMGQQKFQQESGGLNRINGLFFHDLLLKNEKPDGGMGPPSGES
jgi:hypothetical protein